VNDELERMWEEVIVAYFKVLSRNLAEGTEKKPRKISVRIAGLLVNSPVPQYRGSITDISIKKIISLLL
jgi:hypothetical protein